jgi:hypothetical protein
MKADNARRKAEKAAEHLRRLNAMSKFGREVYEHALRQVDKLVAEGKTQTSIYASGPEWLGAYDEACGELIADGYAVEIRSEGSGRWLEIDWSRAYAGGWYDDD